MLSAKNAWGYDMPTDYDTYVEPVQGNSLKLTVDVNIQHYLENLPLGGGKGIQCFRPGAGIS